MGWDGLLRMRISERILSSIIIRGLYTWLSGLCPRSVYAFFIPGYVHRCGLGMVDGLTLMESLIVMIWAALVLSLIGISISLETCPCPVF